jgi:hypothetical protein
LIVDPAGAALDGALELPGLELPGLVAGLAVVADDELLLLLLHAANNNPAAATAARPDNLARRLIATPLWTRPHRTGPSNK